MNIYKCEDGRDYSTPYRLLHCRGRSSRPLPSTPLHHLLNRHLLVEDAIHYGDEQQSHRPAMVLRAYSEIGSTGLPQNIWRMSSGSTPRAVVSPVRTSL